MTNGAFLRRASSTGVPAPPRSHGARASGAEPVFPATARGRRRSGPDGVVRLSGWPADGRGRRRRQPRWFACSGRRSTYPSSQVGCGGTGWSTRLPIYRRCHQSGGREAQAHRRAERRAWASISLDRPRSPPVVGDGRSDGNRSDRRRGMRTGGPDPAACVEQRQGSCRAMAMPEKDKEKTMPHVIVKCVARQDSTTADTTAISPEQSRKMSRRSNRLQRERLPTHSSLHRKDGKMTLFASSLVLSHLPANLLKNNRKERTMPYTAMLVSLSLLVSTGAVAGRALAAEANKTSQTIFRAGSQASFKGLPNFLPVMSV